MNRPSDCSGPCDCASEGRVDRRDFLKLSSLSATALGLSQLSVMAGPFEGGDFEKLVPSDKKLRPDWIKSLYERGRPEVFKDEELAYIGMPVGGIACGQLYLGGDGRLWHWDIFKVVTSTDYESRVWAGTHYAQPMPTTSAIEQGFALEVRAGSETKARFLDRRGFKDVRFRGEYPIGRVEYRAEDLPVRVTLEAFSPFIPLNADDSAHPATILSFKLTNTTDQSVEATLAGWLENAILREGDGGLTLKRVNHVTRDGNRLWVTSGIEEVKQTTKARPDIVFEDWNRDIYEPWKTEGTAFGKGPLLRSKLPEYQRNVGGPNDRVVNSHAAAPGDSIAAKDGCIGKLTSPTFTIERNFISLWIGGGAHADKTAVQLVIDGKVVRSITGKNANQMAQAFLDVRSFQGQKSELRVVDLEPGAWGNIGVGEIRFTDTLSGRPLKDRSGFGTMTLSLLGAETNRSATAHVGDVTNPVTVISEVRQKPIEHSSHPFDERAPIAALARTLTLPPKGEATVDFVLTWYFPNLGEVSGELAAVEEINQRKRHYAAKFRGAEDVATYITANFDRLAQQTRRWNKTWYDSSLPYWLLDRSFVTLDCLATQTFLAFDDGRYWGWEGVSCCPGTCQHVWQYAQGMARIFPEIERRFRERVDFGLAWHEDGAMDYRAENARHVAHDGFCGTILRTYREHQTSADGAFLMRLWPRLKKSIEWILDQDRDRDGLLEGEQMNTLDAAWTGPMGWISSLYLAALAAGETMANELRDEAFAARCRKRLDLGREKIVRDLFDGEYFIHKPADDKHTNTNLGCHIDQMLGQSFAFQMGLPRVIAKPQAQSALEALWKYNFSPDVGVYRNGMKGIIPTARWYAMPGEAGLLMCTWPKGGAEQAPGGGNATFVGYFIECMTGFEYQVAAHMIWEGLIEEGLATTKAIHDRYAAGKRNPYNEVECSDHYSRAMMSHGVFLALCGYEYHGPKGFLAFAPRVTPENFRAPFTAAEGWGTFSQQQSFNEQRATLALAQGKLTLRSLALELPEGRQAAQVSATLQGKPVNLTHEQSDRRFLLQFRETLKLTEGESFEVSIRC